MADQAAEKSVEQLKVERTTAKRLFTRLVNSITRTYREMSEKELVDSFKNVIKEAEKVMCANEDVETGFITELEAELEPEEDAVLSKQQKADIAKTFNECNEKLREVKSLIQEALWDNFGEVELSTALQAAEEVCEHAADARPDGSQEAYNFMLNHLQGLVKTAKEACSRWKQWIPPSEQKEFQSRMKRLELLLPKLISRKADYMEDRKEEEGQRPLEPTAATIRLKPIALPKFTGNKRDFHRWKKDWEALQKQGEPTGSREVRKFQLLDSLDERIARDLRLTSYNTAVDIFRVLENRYGNKIAIAIDIVEELQRMPAAKSHQPRKIVELIQAVEKALQDLSDLGDTGAIKNPLVAKSIESKLPETLKKEWLVYVADRRNAVAAGNRFDSLLAFLKAQESIYEQLEQLREEEPNRKETRTEPRYARTKSTKSEDDQLGCVVCGDGKHKKKLYFCNQFRALRLAEKTAAVRRLGACKRCLEVHEDASYCKTDFLCKNQACKDEHAPEHHFSLCPNATGRRSSITEKKHRCGPGRDTSRRRHTEDQEEFLKKLSPELAKQCRDVFSNATSRVLSTTKDPPGLLVESGLEELPVLMMLLEVTSNAGQKIGTLIDLASDTNYITHCMASKLNLRREEVTLVVHGVGGMKVRVETKRYLLRIRVRTSKGTLRTHQMVCYGLDRITNVHRNVTPEQLQSFFPNIPQNELVRPKQVHLLISHREGQLAPQRIKAVGDLILWDGPLGKTVGGTHPDLFEKPQISAHMSKTHFARSMRAAAVRYEELTSVNSSTSTTRKDFLEWWKWDSIGAACEPKCGGCRCGKCQPGGKGMTLAEEREVELMKEGLTYVKSDSYCKDPHRHSRYPLLEDTASLHDNRRAVEATFQRTEKQLAKEPEWKVAYAEQVHDMVDRRAAIKLTKDTRKDWKGPVWYVSHLIGPNPDSVTTPVRLVWSSSRKWQNGPEFLKLPASEWPIKSAKDLASAARESINKLQKKTFAAATRAKAKEAESDQHRARTEQRRSPAGSTVLDLVDVKRFSSLTQLVKTIAWIWKAAKKFMGQNRAVESSKWEAVSSAGVVAVKEREDVLRDIFLAMQEGATFPSTTTDRLVVYKEEDSGLLVCGGRVQIFKEDQVAVPILPYSTWVSTLLAREAHQESHDGVAGTLLKMRKRAWVIRGRRIAQKVVDGCIICRKAKARKCQQVMGDLPPERTEPSAPFKFTTIDLFGPYQVKDDVKKRVKLKVWGVVFCCMASRAIHTELVNTVSTEGFLMAYQRFTAIRGHPRKIWSDPGTNFIGAKPVLDELYRFLDSLNKPALFENAAKNGTAWMWKINPADSPHRNGAAEAAVRIVKRALQTLGRESELTYSEFQTTLHIAANLANERPIDARIQSREDSIQYITPNTLLLGRASQRGDVQTFDFASYPYKRLRAMQSEVTKFWKHWSQLAGPNLFVRSKWHTAERNVAVGDVVWLCDQNALRGQFKLGRVISTNADSRGVVRDVNIRIFPNYNVPVTRPTKEARASRPVQSEQKEKIQSTILHRDVRRLVVLLPTEDQNIPT